MVMNRKLHLKVITRRHFVKVTGITTLGLSSVGFAGCSFSSISLVVPPEDPVAASPVTGWAVEELVKALRSKGIRTRKYTHIPSLKVGDLCILTAGSDYGISKDLLGSAGITIPGIREALGLVPVNSNEGQILLATGYDGHGLMYAVLELADRVQNSSTPVDALNLAEPLVEKPANEIRGLNRLFVSEIEDKGWFNDRKMWPQYLSMLATQRFNRFTLSIGIGYDFLQNVTDAYFLFPYPFFLDVEGYDVRVPQLPDSERDNNLEMLRFISDETAARGMHFQLGLWMHGYEWLNSPDPNYTIEGLSAETHAVYCRDALRKLLQACPSIGGITFRIHGESGVTEGSYNLWKTIFDGAVTCGRKVEIDMHAKGMSPDMIETALSTGLPVNISPKYWAEHLGLPYHQADIRAQEIPRAGSRTSGLMNLSAGSRSFTRYGYADLLREDRKYKVVHRIWPGTQRLLLWGNPLMSAAHSKAFGFCGSSGVDLMEPLSFKGRRGSGIPGGRCGYLDETLKPEWDWEKYLYSLRVFGRLTYNPETDPDVWRRFLKDRFGKAYDAVEKAVANVSAILPVITTVHGASAANNMYWPEMYTNMSIADPRYTNPYSDTPSPKVFGNVSPFDPELFLSVNECAKEMLTRASSGKYSPLEAACWIEDYADAAEKYLQQAEALASDKGSPEFRRMAVDVAIMIGLGRFFADKFRAAVLYGIYQQSGYETALMESVEYYSKAREVWDNFSAMAANVYKADITIGENPEIRGHWRDRLRAIDDDIAFISALLEEAPASPNDPGDNVKMAVEEVKGDVLRFTGSVDHIPPEQFTQGQEVKLTLTTDSNPSQVLLHYRNVNHAERFESADMIPVERSFEARIPASYTDTEYPLQYYFEIRQGPGRAWLYPGFKPDLANQPYYVVRSK